MAVNKNYYDVIVLGGGASGLMCAFTAAARQRRVLLIERANKVGKKILMSGGGRCNFTNRVVEPDHYISQNPHFCKSALKRYTSRDFIALVQQYQIPFHERDHGQLFCDNSAKEILAMLLAECEKAGVEIRTLCEVKSIQTTLVNAQNQFQLETNRGEFRAEKLVVATGGLSIPTMGSTGFGYEIAQQFGMEVLPVRAGLVPLTFSDHIKAMNENLAGVSLQGEIAAIEKSFREAILFTHRGLSGPAVLQISNYWQSGETLSIDLLPDIDLWQALKGLKQSSPKSLLRNLLTNYLPKSLVLELEKLWWPQTAEKPIAEYADKSLKEIADCLENWSLKPSGTEGYRTAEVTLGGVDTNGLSSKTMESNTQPGLYFIGEVVDVTGHLGGFNFQWAWSSAYAAGQAV